MSGLRSVLADGLFGGCRCLGTVARERHAQNLRLQMRDTQTCALRGSALRGGARYAQHAHMFYSEGQHTS
eukprot:8862607-Alexandrium_andersonii.AAC.1